MDLFQKVGFVLKLWSQSQHVGAILLPFKSNEIKKMDPSAFAWLRTWQAIAFWMRLSISNKNHPIAKQRWSVYGQETRKAKKLHISEIFNFFRYFYSTLPTFQQDLPLHISKTYTLIFVWKRFFPMTNKWMLHMPKRLTPYAKRDVEVEKMTKYYIYF